MKINFRTLSILRALVTIGIVSYVAFLFCCDPITIAFIAFACFVTYIVCDCM